MGEASEPRAAGRADRRTVLLVAGEASGDLHGARLARELLRADPTLRLVGTGGPAMADAGVRLLAGLDELSVMGLAEVARRLPALLALRRRLRRRLLRRSVDLFIPIDFPEFNLSLAEGARRRGVPVLYYIVPQVWAWREGRARRLARACDLACAVLPFEEPLLAGYGVKARFVGHPLLDREPDTREASPGTPGGAAEVGGGGGGRAGARPVLALFPGSRRQEIERMLPPFTAAARLVRRRRPSVRVVVAAAPGLDRGLYGEGLPGALVPPTEARRAATAALTKSGTVTLELALAGVPMVVGHRLHPITYRVARRFVRVDHIALANLVAERRVVPELVQGEVTPKVLAAAVLPLLEPGTPERLEVREGLATVRERLGTPGASRRVAAAALSLLEGGRQADEPPEGGR